MRLHQIHSLILFLICFALAKETTLIEFNIQDQFKRHYNQNSFDDRIIILFGADREGSQYTNEWGPTLADSLKRRGIIDKIQFVALANLDGVPGLMKKIVKGLFPKDKEKWILLDWDGVFEKAYNFVPATCNILVFDTQKNLLFQHDVTVYDEVIASSVCKSIATTTIPSEM